MKTLVLLSLLSTLALRAEVLTNLTLELALDLAERHHPDLRESRALIDAAAGRARTAGQLPNPQGIARIESGARRNEAEFLAGFSQEVPLGTRLARAREVASGDLDRQAAQLEVTRAALHQRVRAGFATALFQIQAAQTEATQAENFEKTTAIVRSRVELGDATPDELARAEMELLRRKLAAQRGAALQHQSLSELSAILGGAPVQIHSLAGELAAAFELPSLESIAAELASHPAITLAAADLRVQSARVDLAQAERIPDLNVELLYRRAQSERRDSFDVAVSIPIPLFDRGQGRLQTARAELEATRARARATELRLHSDLQQTHSRLNLALEHARLLQNDLIPRAESILKTAEARLRAGDISLAETILLRRDFAEVQLARLDTLREVMQAWAELQPFLQRLR